jgi:hypothetical protein
MTVGEAILKLQKFPPEMELVVWVTNIDGGEYQTPDIDTHCDGEMVVIS